MQTLKTRLETLTYEVLTVENKEDLKEAALCLAQTFTGIQVGNSFIREPMSYACNLSTEQFTEFAELYLEAIVPHGLTVVAKDEDGKIVGVLACEDFNPEEEVPVFDGELEPMNHIIQFLLEIDIKFLEKLESTLNLKVQKEEFVHAFMVGVRLEKDKKHVAVKLFEVLTEVALEKGYKGVFGEATNIRSQKLMFDLLGYYNPTDINGERIALRYDTHSVFETIPYEISEECSLVFKAFDKKYEI